MQSGLGTPSQPVGDKTCWYEGLGDPLPHCLTPESCGGWTPALGPQRAPGVSRKCRIWVFQPRIFVSPAPSPAPQTFSAFERGLSGSEQLRLVSMRPAEGAGVRGGPPRVPQRPPAHHSGLLRPQGPTWCLVLFTAFQGGSVSFKLETSSAGVGTLHAWQAPEWQKRPVQEGVVGG